MIRPYYMLWKGTWRVIQTLTPCVSMLSILQGKTQIIPCNHIQTSGFGTSITNETQTVCQTSSMIEHCNVACDSSTYMLESPISNLWQSICVVALTTLVCRGKSLGLSKELTMSEETILVDSNILYCHLSMSCGFQIHIFTSCLPSNMKPFCMFQ